MKHTSSHFFTLTTWKHQWGFITSEQQIKRELKGIHVCGCRCNERLKAKTDSSMCLTYTGLCGELEHLKIQTRLTDESFECVMGECVI